MGKGFEVRFSCGYERSYPDREHKQTKDKFGRSVCSCGVGSHVDWPEGDE